MQQADVQNRGFLDFTDFKRFVKSLKARPEVERRYKKLCSLDNGSFSYRAFDHFMRFHQKVGNSANHLVVLLTSPSSRLRPRRNYNASSFVTLLLLLMMTRHRRFSCFSMAGRPTRLLPRRTSLPQKTSPPLRYPLKASRHSCCPQITPPLLTRTDPFIMT
jgi:hypothetical protein